MKANESDVRVLIAVDNICDSFEAEFRNGRTPQISEFVNRVEPSHRSTLIHELIALEIQLLADRGEPLSEDVLLQKYLPLVPDTEKAALRSTIARALSSSKKETSDPDATASFKGSETKSAPPFPRIDGFEIESVLGRGGMGIVYKATQQFPRRPVALKMILDHRRYGDEEAEEFFQRFLKEAQAVADLNDPHFVQIYQFGESDGRPYMALEFVEGGSLENYRNREPQPIEFAVRIVEQLAQGMEKSHRAGLVHRDLKPHNVLLTAQGDPKIADFGLAKRLDQDAQLTRDGGPLGTPSYMAPEQTYGTRDVGPAADIYALGGILYCLLTGRPPFQAANWRDVLDQVCNQEPVPPSRLNPKVPRDLETICLKCLRKEPGHRYASALALAEDLRRFREGIPILARPVGVIERAWRWSRRNPWIAGLTAGIAILLIAVTVIPSVLAVQLSQRNKDLVSAHQAQQEQLNAALDVVRTEFFVIDEHLRGVPLLGNLRSQLIDGAMKGLDVVREGMQKHPFPDIDNPLVERTEAIAHQRLGEIYANGGRIEDAQKELAVSHAVLERLFNADRDNPVNVRNLAGNLNLQGDVHLRLGNSPEAQACYERALKLRERWRELLPDHEDTQWALAQSHGLVGKIHMLQGQPTAALKHFQSAKSLYDLIALPEDPFEAMTMRRERAANEHRLGDIYYQLGNNESAEKNYKLALELREAAARDGNELAGLLRDVAGSQQSLGDFYLQAHDDPATAWSHYDAALAIFLKLARSQPGHLQARRDVAAVQYRLGTTFRRARERKVKLANGKESPDPKPHFEQARTLREELAKDPQDIQSRLEWALASACCGRTSEAESLAREIEKVGQDRRDFHVLFHVACIYSLCSDSQDQQVVDRCRSASIRILKQLVDARWQGATALKNDPDLDPLRKSNSLEPLAMAIRNRGEN